MKLYNIGNINYVCWFSAAATDNCRHYGSKSCVLFSTGTTAHVGIRLFGEYGRSARQHVMKAGAFQRNCSDTFIIAYDVNLGDLQRLHIWHDNSGLSPSWYLSHVIINDMQTDNKYYFFGDTWLSLEKENGSIQKEIKAAGKVYSQS